MVTKKGTLSHFPLLDEPRHNDPTNLKNYLHMRDEVFNELLTFSHNRWMQFPRTILIVPTGVRYINLIMSSAKRKAILCLSSFTNFKSASGLREDTAFFCLKCKICAEMFDNSGELKKHVSSIHKPNYFVCELCKKKFKYNQTLKTHMKCVHSQGDLTRFSCEHCDRKFWTKWEMSLHIDTVHMNKFKLYCQTCRRGFNNPYLLRDHERKIHEKRLLTCIHCNKSFKDNNYFKLHLKTHDPNYKAVEYKCKECSKVLKCIRSYNFHMNSHSGKNKNVCDICGKIVTSKGSLRDHMRSHVGEKPFKCDFCDKQFVAQKYLTAHRRVHTKEKPFVCDVCGKGFTQKGSLNIHSRYHTGERPYECTICLKKFVTKTVLKYHQCKGC
ncbi:hypothetical protein NQ318_020907 [Aromia moschata]|uniref:C2H2-type domain-containing protein n=1 Tax=Aromia moschata TaxID=1265417 RepID=A0AAV8XZC8_9CUCU|nr:hypothetical protein NQ318_020907 [Aromia moschata]